MPFHDGTNEISNEKLKNLTVLTVLRLKFIYNVNHIAMEGKTTKPLDIVVQLKSTRMLPTRSTVLRQRFKLSYAVSAN